VRDLSTANAGEADQMIKKTILISLIACIANSGAIAADKCRGISSKIEQARCYAHSTGSEAKLENMSRRVQAIQYVRTGEAVAAALIASDRCDEMNFNSKLAVQQLKADGFINPQELEPFINDVVIRFETDGRLACKIAWSMHGPGAQNGYKLLYLADPKYADPRLSSPSGFSDAFDRSR
jgi:hypothetical protein